MREEPKSLEAQVAKVISTNEMLMDHLLLTLKQTEEEAKRIANTPHKKGGWRWPWQSSSRE